MKLESHFNVGDKVWICMGGEPREATVGYIQMTYIKRKRQAPELEERYMTHEYGIVSGSFFIYGKSIYATRDECIAGNQAAIAEKARLDSEHREQERQWALDQIAEAQAMLEKLDAA